MSESLKQKAEFPSDWCSYCTVEKDECANSGCPLNELWVRLEDAEKILEKQKKKFQHKLHQILDELSIWTPEKIEQHLSAFLNKDLRDLCWRTEQFVRVVDLQKKFEELLENE